MSLQAWPPGSKKAAHRSPGSSHSSPEDTGRDRSLMKVLVSANKTINVCCISWNLPLSEIYIELYKASTGPFKLSTSQACGKFYS